MFGDNMRKKPKKHICHVCHDEEENGCCSDEIFVTVHDLLRIAKRTGIHIDKLALFKKPKKDLYELWVDNEDLSGYMIKDKMLIMKGKDEDCKFLGDKGCRIFGFRPGVCRMFPFWFDVKKGKLSLRLDLSEDYEDDWCLICRNNYHESDLKRAFEDAEETEKGLMKFAKMYKKELDLYKRYAPLLAKGAKPSDIVVRFKIKV